jgi:hypothetical protein
MGTELAEGHGLEVLRKKLERKKKVGREEGEGK